ncbi:PF04255 domain protein [Leptospira alstonii serovar Pingchang str. 80-412]|uniref:PF04255 domain protein n=2 Tax=Leptospira alstonii TaxID=28452 RepID=M6D2R5_9LEPT|nr:PF04255 domain protein [Leptospira alstonii serovar Sichuan str. 79601]EQA81027.1 PF04255 domain protein [Leptospira alstonii serovar Pingchang str. 80-412]
MLLSGISRKGILREYPGISNDDIDSAVSFLEAKLEIARQNQYTNEKVS